MYNGIKIDKVLEVTMPFKTGTMPISEHFKLITLAEGVYVAIATAGGGQAVMRASLTWETIP